MNVASLTDLSRLQNAIDVLESEQSGVLRRKEKEQVCKTEQRKQNQRRLGSFPADRQTDRQTDTDDIDKITVVVN